MVASFDIYEALEWIEVIIFVFYFWIAVCSKRQFKHKIMLLIAVSISFTINLVQLPREIVLLEETNWKKTFIALIFWFVYAIYLGFWIGKDIATKANSSSS